MRVAKTSVGHTGELDIVFSNYHLSVLHANTDYISSFKYVTPQIVENRLVHRLYTDVEYFLVFERGSQKAYSLQSLGSQLDRTEFKRRTMNIS